MELGPKEKNFASDRILLRNGRLILPPPNDLSSKKSLSLKITEYRNGYSVKAPYTVFDVKQDKTLMEVSRGIGYFEKKVVLIINKI